VRAPTDLELMLFYDGEIVDEGDHQPDPAAELGDEPPPFLLRARADEIAQWLGLARSPLDRVHGRANDDADADAERAWAIHEGLETLGELVRAEQTVRAPTRSVSDAVMLAIELPEAAELLPLSPAGTAASPPPPSVAAEVGTVRDGLVVRPRFRSWFAGPGFVVAAAAAACVVFVLRGPEAPIGDEPPVPAMLVASTSTVPSFDNGGVAVDTVDFGTKMGTIFLQPGEASLRDNVTTVVWIRDEEPRP
jgi:hypothetical protein